MTLPEFLGYAAGAIGTFTATYVATARKVTSAVGAKAPGDDSLRDMLARVEGKIDTHHEVNSERFDRIENRLKLVEQRVFTPPSMAAIRAARVASKKE